MKIGSNKDINKDHKELPMTPPEPGKTEGTALTMDKPIKDHLKDIEVLVDGKEQLGLRGHILENFGK